MADATFAKITNVRFTDDPNAQVFNMSDEEFRKIWKYQYADVVSWCRANIAEFKKGRHFDSIMRKIKTDIECAYTRHLDSKNTRSPSQTFYTDKALMEIKTQYKNTN
jgi:hypothetical protein